ncbi:MAG: BolA family transcriptional regulator, partial [Pseudomonadota bacterium]|nr:BolA family transcriptional regulator [Pseudomonadota bacterium]
AEALQGPVHALALHTYTPTEWETRGGQSMVSPNCLDGSKHDQ